MWLYLRPLTAVHQAIYLEFQNGLAAQLHNYLITGESWQVAESALQIAMLIPSENLGALNLDDIRSIWELRTQRDSVTLGSELQRLHAGCYNKTIESMALDRLLERPPQKPDVMSAWLSGVPQEIVQAGFPEQMMDHLAAIMLDSGSNDTQVRKAVRDGIKWLTAEQIDDLKLQLRNSRSTAVVNRVFQFTSHSPEPGPVIVYHQPRLPGTEPPRPRRGRTRPRS